MVSSPLVAFCVVSDFVAEGAGRRVGRGGPGSERHITITAS